MDDIPSLDASVKKCTAFIKRLKSVTADNHEAIVGEFCALRLSKYLEEAVASLLENRLRSAGDVAALVEVRAPFGDFHLMAC